MDKEKVFQMAKTDLQRIIEQLSLDTLTEDVAQSKRYLVFLETLSTLVSPPNLDKQTIGLDEVDEVLHGDGELEEEKGSRVDQLDANTFVFERKLKGGQLQDIDAYVPEKVIRQLGLNQGDYVRATLKKTGEVNSKRKHYFFELVKKGEGKDQDRKVIPYCVVEKDGGLWVCNQTMSGENIKLGELPFTIRIKESEIMEFHLEEGDIVDIAYFADNPSYCRVVWKHHIKPDRYSTPLPSSVYKEKYQSNRKVIENIHLKDKVVTLIGCIDRQAAYRERLTTLGATFQAMDGTEDEQRIAALIKKSNMVIIIIPAVSHNGSATAKKYCKEYNIPFKMCETIGTSTVIHYANNLAKESEYNLSPR
ncbi:DUF2325 domain-containing protein [Pseudalkalibacillus decolorationis]|uniref:DUF2325 domain-containing protein n=1 Tax=Pseudalkalibacillus decolorationis TaxID=163879 RepID=UPI0021488AB5|nr:DUF2325 domain-containing protein [Pseudalkalibacillus decolorationis]